MIAYHMVARAWSARDYGSRVDGHFEARLLCTRLFGWAIPSIEAINAIQEAVGNRPVVEVGAGTGYWGFLLKQAGVSWVGLDECPGRQRISDAEVKAAYDHALSVLYSTAAFARSSGSRTGRYAAIAAQLQEATALFPEGLDTYQPATRLCWAPVEVSAVSDAAVWESHPENQPGRVLMLCWPPYAEPMGFHALKGFRGDRLVYIGERYGGCTGDDAFHELLEAEWDTISEHALPQWEGINDRLFIYQRNT